MALPIVACLVACSQPEAPPNVVLILADTLRADSLSTYGYERPTSPRLDAFAKQSFVFENAISVGASTPPTLSAIMTGRLPYYEASSLWSPTSAHGMRRFYRDGEQKGLPLSLETLAERFQEAGYETIGIVNNAYIKRVYHFEQGFDEFVELFNKGNPRYGLAEQITERATGFLRQPHEKPFFLYVHYMDPHAPHVPPEPYRSDFATGAEGVQRVRDRYDGSIRYMDHWIGELLAELSKDERKNTIIAFVTDHGEEFGDHGGQGHTGTLYEELVHVPFMISGPGIPAAREKALVRNFDVGPTLLDLAGAGDMGQSADAVSLAGLIRGDEAGARAPVLASFPVIPNRSVHPLRPARRMLRDDRYKLILNLNEPDQSALFDLETDPGETQNIYATSPEVIARMRSELDAIVAKLDAENAAADARQTFIRLEGKDVGLLLPKLGSSVRVTRQGRAVLRSAKHAPAVHLPYLPVGEDGRLYARLRLGKPARAARASYRTAEDPTIRAERSVDGRFSDGGRTLDVEIEAKTLVGSVLIEFGEAPGRVELESVSIARSPDDLAGSASPGGNSAEREDGQVDDATIEQLRALGYVE